MTVNEIGYGDAVVRRSTVQVTDRDSSDASWKEGDILEGRVLETGARTRLSLRVAGRGYTDGAGDATAREITVPSDSMGSTYKGDVRRFEVVEAAQGKLVLKDLGSIYGESVAAGMQSVTVNSGLSRMIDDFRETMGTDEKKDNDSIERLSDEDYSELRREGFSIEDFKAERLARAIERIKVTRRELKETVERESEALAKQRRNIERRSAERAAEGTGLTAIIAERLVEADLPVTQENVAEIATAARMGSSAAHMGDGAFAYLIKNNLEPTAGNIYRSVYAGHLRREQMAEGDWLAIEEEASKVAYEAGSSTEDARWMLEYDIPITRENLLYKKNLSELQKSYAAGEGADRSLRTGLTEGRETSPAYRTIEAAVAAIAEGRPAEDALLISEGAADDAASRAAMMPIVRELNARLGLEQARLKLTCDSARAMKAAGIDPEVAGLEQIVEALREAERDAYRQLARELGIGEEDTTGAETEHAVSLAQSTAEALFTISRAPESLYAQTFDQRHEITPAGLSAAAGAIGSYEASATQVRPDLGDSLKKAFEGIDDILRANDMELTEANRRAVRILGSNSMEITPESINDMKYYAGKVTGLVESMKPAVVLSMIRKGTDPLNTDIDTLRERVDELMEAEGYSPEEKYSSFLVRMENAGQLTEREREAYIGIYRLLYQVSKNDGAAIGAAVKSGKKLTLKNLLTEVRSAAHSGMDARIDDETPVTASSYTDPIAERLEEALGYQRRMISGICDTDEPLSWQQIPAEASSYEEITTEELYERLVSADNNMGDHRAAEAVRELMLEEPGVRTYLRNFGLDDSFNNTRAVLRSEALETRDEAELLDMLDTAVTDGVEAFTEEYIGRLDAERNRIADILGGTVRAAEASELTAQLARYDLLESFSREQHFEYDVRGGARVRLTVVSGRGTSGSLHIEVRKADGVIRADLSVRGSGSDRAVKGTVAFESEEAVKAAAEDYSSLKAELEAEGISSEEIRVFTDRISDERYMSRLGEIKKRAGKGDTEVAGIEVTYRVARMFLEHFL